MGSVNLRWMALLLISIALTGCGRMMEDLKPSNSDKHHSGQIAPDFTLPDTNGASVSLLSVLSGTTVNGVVLYFTMWCPTCDVHMSSMRSSHIPIYPTIRFFAVDYVSGTVADAGHSELSNGYAGSGFTVLADTTQSVLNLYHATMGTTVVIDKTGMIRMNEDYKDDRLTAVLTGLP